MLREQVGIFLSWSEKFKQPVAWPVRAVLADHGLRGLIMSDEPPLPGTRERPEAKVESYLDASSAFVALCTADYGLSDGTKYPRANIIDEIQRASLRPHLRDRSQILKPPEVLLPSRVTPTYDGLDIASPAGAAEGQLTQLHETGVTNPPAPARTAAAEPDRDTGGGRRGLFAGLPPGDHDEASQRAYRLLLDGTADDGVKAVRTLHREVMEAHDPAWQLTGATLLQAPSRLDASLVSAEKTETLAAHPEYPPRACAANLLRDRAIVAPLDVPLRVLRRLPSPSTDDWDA